MYPGICDTHVLHPKEFITAIISYRTDILQLFLQRTHRRCRRLLLCGRSPARVGGRSLMRMKSASRLLECGIGPLERQNRQKHIRHCPGSSLKKSPLLAPSVYTGNIKLHLAATAGTRRSGCWRQGARQKQCSMGGRTRNWVKEKEGCADKKSGFC